MYLNIILQNQIFFTFSFILLVLLATSTKASESAHEHGVGTLSIAVEGHEVEIELTIPGSDVVGFEHLPSSKKERQAVIAGAKSLRDVTNILVLSPKANCNVKDVEVSSGLLEDQKDDHGHGNKHKHEEKDKDNHKEVHSEFIAHYHFKCKNPKLLNSVQLGFFKAFPSAHELDAKWITPKGQGASELTPNSPNLIF
jgi:hypothetical protein